MVERNLGFEAEHHQRALHGIQMTRHRIDHTAKRYGILTTEDVKLGMMTLLNNMLREQRVNIFTDLVSDDAKGNKRRLREQLSIYSFQFKSAPDTFGKGRVSLNGKVVLQADNMFRPQRAVLAPGLLRPSGNQLSVHLLGGRT